MQPMGGELFRGLIASGEHDHRDVAARRHVGDADERIATFEHRHVTGHGVEAFRLAPERSNRRMQFGRQLPHFADEPFERLRGGGSEDFDEIPRCRGRAAGEQRQARADHAEMREQRPDSGQLLSAA